MRWPQLARGVKLGGRRQTRERFQEIAAKGRKAAAAVNRKKRERFQEEMLPLLSEIITSGATTLRAIADGKQRTYAVR